MEPLQNIFKRGTMKRKPREFEEKSRNKVRAGGHSGNHTRSVGTMW